MWEIHERDQLRKPSAIPMDSESRPRAANIRQGRPLEARDVCPAPSHKGKICLNDKETRRRKDPPRTVRRRSVYWKQRYWDVMKQ
jgi:hypothetical protein